MRNKTMIGLACGAALLALVLGQMARPTVAAEQHLAWLDNLPAAQARAKVEKKLVLMDFTGSDWCPLCAQARKDVFTTQEFADYATNHLVLMEVDFPEKKPQSAELVKANKALSEKYKVEGFPTFIVLDGEGKERGRIEYEPGGPKQFIARLEKLKKT